MIFNLKQYRKINYFVFNEVFNNHDFMSIPIKERFEEVEYWEEKMAEVKKKITRSTSDKEEKTMDR